MSVAVGTNIEETETGSGLVVLHANSGPVNVGVERPNTKRISGM